MFRKTVLTLLLVFNAFALIASGAEQGKIPVTTTSEKARQDYLQGRDLFDRLKIHDSVAFYQKAIAEDPKMAIAYLGLAQSAPSANEFFDNQKKAVGLAGQVSEGERLWILGAEAGANGFPMKANEYFEKLVAAYPNDERAHNLLATNLFGLQKYDEAIEHFRKAIEINPKFSTAYNLLGYALRFNENYAESEKAFQKYIELIPDDPNPYDSYAELLMKMGRFDESIANYRKALAIDPHFVASRIGIATNLNFKGQYAKAREELKKMYETARDQGERRQACFAMSVSYVAEGNTAKALEQEEIMLAMVQKTNDPAAIAGDLNTMGTILLEAGRTDEARAKFEQSIKTINASELSAEQKANAQRGHLFNMARVAIEKKDLATAKAKSAELRKQAEAVHNQFQIWQAHELDGLIAMQEKHFDRAVTELKQGNMQNPQNLHWLAEAYEAKGDTEQAQATFKRVAEFNSLNNLVYAFVRDDAQKMMAKK